MSEKRMGMIMMLEIGNEAQSDQQSQIQEESI